VFAALYLSAAIIGARLPNAWQPQRQSKSHEILLIIGTIHTDIALPITDETRRAFAFASDSIDLNTPQSQWLIAGWGSEAFYTSVGSYKDIRLAPTLKAITGDRSVVRLWTASHIPKSYRTHKIQLTSAQFKKLLEFTTSNLKSDDILQTEGNTKRDAFFKHPKRFHIFQTCNTWVAQALYAANVPFGQWTPTPFAIKLAYRWHIPSPF
jgi:uncharacterized protein (TIGR02117 family)